MEKSLCGLNEPLVLSMPFLRVACLVRLLVWYVFTVNTGI